MTSIPLEAGKINPADPPKELTLLGGAPARWGNNKPFQTVQETWKKYGWVPNEGCKIWAEEKPGVHEQPESGKG